MFRKAPLFVVALAVFAVSANAALISQYGILDLTANGGINPNTGVAWAEGDQYRLAFYTKDLIDGTSNDPAVYDNFATAQAQQNPALASSTGWTAMVWVNTDPALPQGSALSSPSLRAGITDVTGGEGVGGAGVPVYAMDGTTCIARNNAVIMSEAWKSPFANVDSGWGPNGQPADSYVRLPAGLALNVSQVCYSPFLDQFGAGDSGANHGASIMTGGFPDRHINAVGPASDEGNYNWGSSNATTKGRIWNRSTTGVPISTAYGVYAISELLTVTVIPGVIGDVNVDGVVDAADYLMIKQNLGGPPSGAGTGGDLDGDGTVTVVDLGALANALNGAAGGATIPEPASLGLLAFGALAVVRRRRK